MLVEAMRINRSLMSPDFLDSTACAVCAYCIDEWVRVAHSLRNGSRHSCRNIDSFRCNHRISSRNRIVGNQIFGLPSGVFFDSINAIRKIVYRCRSRCSGVGFPFVSTLCTGARPTKAIIDHVFFLCEYNLWRPLSEKGTYSVHIFRVLVFRFPIASRVSVSLFCRLASAGRRFLAVL